MCLANRKAGRIKNKAWRISDTPSLYICWLSGEILLLSLLLYITSKFYLYHKWLIQNNLTTYRHMLLLKPPVEQKLAPPATNQVIQATPKTAKLDSRAFQIPLTQQVDVGKLTTEPKTLSIPSKSPNHADDASDNLQTLNRREKVLNKSELLEKIPEHSLQSSSSRRRAASSKDIKISIQSKSFPPSQQVLPADPKQSNSALASPSLNDSSNKRLLASEKPPLGGKMKKIIALETKNSPLRKSNTQRDKPGLDRQDFFE